MSDTVPCTEWPSDREAVRFEVLSQPDRRGLQTIRALFWTDEGARSFRQHFAASLDALIGSARRRGVVFDVVDRSGDLAQAAA